MGIIKGKFIAGLVGPVNFSLQNEKSIGCGGSNPVNLFTNLQKAPASLHPALRPEHRSSTFHCLFLLNL